MSYLWSYDDGNDDRAVSQFIKNALRHEDIIMKSKGMQLRSYCYIADCATAIFTILLYGNRVMRIM